MLSFLNALHKEKKRLSGFVIQTSKHSENSNKTCWMQRTIKLKEPKKAKPRSRRMFWVRFLRNLMMKASESSGKDRMGWRKPCWRMSARPTSLVWITKLQDYRNTGRIKFKNFVSSLPFVDMRKVEMFPSTWRTLRMMLARTWKRSNLSLQMPKVNLRLLLRQLRTTVKPTRILCVP